MACPLPSWNDGAAKEAILEFVAAVTDEDGKDYVKPADRIATFDNDGTLWVEYPMYTQVLFAFERVKELAPQHPVVGVVQQRDPRKQVAAEPQAGLALHPAEPAELRVEQEPLVRVRGGRRGKAVLAGGRRRGRRLALRYGANVANITAHLSPASGTRLSVVNQQMRRAMQLIVSAPSKLIAQQ